MLIGKKVGTLSLVMSLSWIVVLLSFKFRTALDNESRI
jgi:hypothetical protein